MTVSVSKADWSALSDEDRRKIQDIIGKNFKGETVTPEESLSAKVSNNPACEALCNGAETAAIAACNALPFPANAVCVVAAKSAGDYCRSRC